MRHHECTCYYSDVDLFDEIASRCFLSADEINIAKSLTQNDVINDPSISHLAKEAYMFSREVEQSADYNTDIYNNIVPVGCINILFIS